MNDHQEPPWSGPPPQILGSELATQVLLHRSEHLVIAVGGFVAYPDGVRFDVRLRFVEPSAYDVVMDDTFRLSVELSDGRVASEYKWWPVEEGPQGPVLVPQGAGGDSLQYDAGYWLWPLPPPGKLTIVCDSQRLRVVDARVGLDADPMIAAAKDALTLWP